MDLTYKKTIKELLAKYGAKAEKGLGQHFILSKKALVKMIAAAEIKKRDVIVEVGPGLGTLTRELAATEAKIITIEKDPMMLNILGETLADYKNVKIVQADARTIGVGNPLHGKYKIVANLPYNVATFLIHQWLEAKRTPEVMVLMIQKEVAQRICAEPPRMNLLAVSVQFYAEAEIIDYVPAEAFWPRPKIDSAIIKIIPKKKKPLQKTRDAFFAIVKAGFSQPRKQLIGNLTKKLSAKGESQPRADQPLTGAKNSGGNTPKEKILKIFQDLNIPERARAENLSLEQWVSLVNFLH